MKKTYRKVEKCKEHILLNNPITKLIISDPSYDSSIEYRYENNHIPPMVLMGVFLSLEHLYDEKDDLEFDTEECIIHMINPNIMKQGEVKEREFDIEVDTERYQLKTNHGCIDILTMSDDYWGPVTEKYFDGYLGMIEIRLIVPNMSMNNKEFFDALKPLFKIKEDIQFVTISEENIDIAIEKNEQELNPSETMKMR